MEERLAVDEGLGVYEGVGEMEGVVLKGTPETRIRKPGTPVGAAPAAAKATVAVKGYAAASRVTGSSVLGE